MLILCLLKPLLVMYLDMEGSCLDSELVIALRDPADLRLARDAAGLFKRLLPLDRPECWIFILMARIFLLGVPYLFVPSELRIDS